MTKLIVVSCQHASSGWHPEKPQIDANNQFFINKVLCQLPGCQLSLALHCRFFASIPLVYPELEYSGAQTPRNLFGVNRLRIIGYLFLLLIVVLGVSFATLNSVLVTINYYIGTKVLPLSLLLAIFFVTGCVLGVAVNVFLLFKLKLYNYRLKQQLKLAEKEIENLRAIPLQGNH